MSYREQAEKMAADIKEHSAKEEARRKEELERLQKQMVENREMSQKLTQIETEKREAEDKRHETKREAVYDRNRRAYEANMAREDRRLKEINEKERRALDNQFEVMKKLKDFYSEEISKKSKNQLDLMERKEKKLKEEEARVSEKVIELKEKKQDLQEKVKEEREKYQNELIEIQKGHYNEIEKLTEEKQDVLTVRLKDEQKAVEQIEVEKKHFVQHAGNVLQAGQSDQIERFFINAVITTKQSGTAATNAISKLGEHAYYLKSDVTAEYSVVKTLEDLTLEAHKKLDDLSLAASLILEQRESRNEKVDACQASAREIDPAIQKMRNSLNKFRGSLTDSPITNSVELYEQVYKDCVSLAETVNAIPAVSQTDHAIAEIQQNVQRLVITSSQNGN